MATVSATSNGKFKLELKYIGHEGVYPEVHLTAIEEVTIFDIAKMLYKDCYKSDLGFSIKYLSEFICIIKTNKNLYRINISNPKSFRNILNQLTKKISI